MTVKDLIYELAKYSPELEVDLEYHKTDCSCADGNSENRCYCELKTFRDSVESIDVVKLDTDGRYMKVPRVVLNFR